MFSEHSTYEIYIGKPDGDPIDKGNYITYGSRNRMWASIDRDTITYEDTLTNFIYRLYEEKESKNLRNYFTENFAKKMDVFQFGFVLNYVYNAYKKDRKGDNEIDKYLKHIVENTYHPNPYARWDIEQVITELNNMSSTSVSPVTTKPPSLSHSPLTTNAPSMTKDVSATVNEILFMDDKSLKTIVDMIFTNKKRSNKKK